MIARIGVAGGTISGLTELYGTSRHGKTQWAEPAWTLARYLRPDFTKRLPVAGRRARTALRHRDRMCILVRPCRARGHIPAPFGSPNPARLGHVPQIFSLL